MGNNDMMDPRFQAVPIRSSELGETLIHSHSVFNGRIINVRHDTVQTVEGAHVSREVVDHEPAVVILPVNVDEQSIVLVRQFRYAIGQDILELPAGIIEKDDASPLDAAKRELAEETGFHAKDWHSMGHYYPTPGFCNELFHFFIASNLVPTVADPDEDERIIVETVPIDRLIAQIESHSLIDLKTVALFQMALPHLRAQ